MFTRSLARFALLALCSTAAQAIPLTYTAELSGAAESPPVASSGTGTATVTYDAEAHTLLVEAGFADLVGSTMAAHIHCCTLDPLAGLAGVATPTPTFPGFPAGVTSGTYSELFDLTALSSFNGAFVTANGGTAAGAEAALAAGLAEGRAYFNIHTDFAPGGEIRGFFMAIPAPATLSLLGLGLGLVFAPRLRKAVAA